MLWLLCSLASDENPLNGRMQGNKTIKSVVSESELWPRGRRWTGGARLRQGRRERTTARATLRNDRNEHGAAGREERTREDRSSRTWGLSAYEIKGREWLPGFWLGRLGQEAEREWEHGGKCTCAPWTKNRNRKSRVEGWESGRRNSARVMVSLLFSCNIWLAITPTGKQWPEWGRTSRETKSCQDTGPNPKEGTKFPLLFYFH